MKSHGSPLHERRYVLLLFFFLERHQLNVISCGYNYYFNMLEKSSRKYEIRNITERKDRRPKVLQGQLLLQKRTRSRITVGKRLSNYDKRAEVCYLEQKREICKTDSQQAHAVRPLPGGYEMSQILIKFPMSEVDPDVGVEAG